MLCARLTLHQRVQASWTVQFNLFCVVQVLRLQLPSLDVDVRGLGLPPAAQAYLAGLTFALAASPCRCAAVWPAQHLSVPVCLDFISLPGLLGCLSIAQISTFDVLLLHAGCMLLHLPPTVCVHGQLAMPCAARQW
jgi:hypothetical protein